MRYLYQLLALSGTLGISACGAPAWHAPVLAAGFAPLGAPTTNLALGTIVVVWRNNPVRYTTVCWPDQWFGGALPRQPERGAGPTESSRVNFEVALEAQLRASIANAGVEGAYGNRLNVAVSRLEYERIAEADVLSGTGPVTACRTAIRRWQAQGVVVSVVTGVYRADVSVEMSEGGSVGLDAEIPILSGAPTCPVPDSSPASGGGGVLEGAPPSSAGDLASASGTSLDLDVGLRFRYDSERHTAAAATIWGIESSVIDAVPNEGGVRLVAAPTSATERSLAQSWLPSTVAASTAPQIATRAGQAR